MIMSENCVSVRHSTVRAARVYHLNALDPQKVADRTHRTVEQVIADLGADLGPRYVVARDGILVGIGAAWCGVHSKDLIRQKRDISAKIVDDLGGRTSDLAIDYAKRVYEKRLDEEAARKASWEKDWRDHQQENHARPVFTVRETDPPERHRGVKSWLIEGRDGDVTYPMTIVEVTDDGDVLWVQTSDYMNSGPGRGNPSWTKALIETLQKAAEVQAEGKL